MRLFTVHIPPAVPRPGRDPIALVPEGTAWWALVFGPLWLARHRLWWPLLGWIGVALLLTLAPAAWALAGGLGLWWLTALAGHDLRRLQLDRRGFELATVVAARDQDQALQRAAALSPGLLPA